MTRKAKVERGGADAAEVFSGLARCMYCGVRGDGDVDHILPVVRGGCDEPFNLCHACARCNRSKADGASPIGAPVVDVWVGRLFDEVAMRRAAESIGAVWTDDESLDRAAAFRMARCMEWHGVRVWSAPKRKRSSRQNRGAL